MIGVEERKGEQGVGGAVLQILLSLWLVCFVAPAIISNQEVEWTYEMIAPVCLKQLNFLFKYLHWKAGAVLHFTDRNISRNLQVLLSMITLCRCWKEKYYPEK